MHKETVSLENIKTDLKEQIKDYRISLIGNVLLFAVFFFFLIFVIFRIVWYFPWGDYSLAEIISGLGGESLPFIITLFLLLGSAIYCATNIIKKVRMVMLLRDSLKNEVCIVKDTLVKSDYISRRRGGNIHFLIFSQYGKYIVPYENYSWSSEFCTSVGGVIIHAFKGTEYYLVVSKAPYQKVLYAYNTNLFELDEQLIYSEPRLY